MAAKNGVFGLVLGFFNVLSFAIFVVPALVVGGCILWLIVTSLLGMNKPDGTEHKFTGQDCGIAGTAIGEVVTTVIREKGVETAGPSACSLKYQAGRFTKLSSEECSADGQLGSLGKIPDPDSWGFNRPQLEICYIFAPLKK